MREPSFSLMFSSSGAVLGFVLGLVQIELTYGWNNAELRLATLIFGGAIIGGAIGVLFDFEFPSKREPPP